MRRSLCFLFPLLTGATACAPEVQVIRYSALPGPSEARASDCEIEIFEPQHRIDRPHVVFGDVFVGEGGFTVGCGKERVLELLREAACSEGAHAVQYIQKIRGRGAECYQVRAKLVEYPRGGGTP